MKNVELNVGKLNVYDEVAKVTSYEGAKAAEDGSAYERVFTTDQDRMLLESYWLDACEAVNDQVKNYLSSVEAQPISHCVELEANYKATLSMPEGYDENLSNSINNTLFSYFVNYIISRWFGVADKENAGQYANQAIGAIDDVMKKLNHRKRPVKNE